MSECATSGWLDGKRHHYPLRVYYAETDAGGVVYHAAYLVFAERARTEMMRLLNIDHVALHTTQGLLFAVRSCEIDFLRSARLDDALVVCSELVHLGGASLQLVQSVRRGEEELARLTVRLVCMHMAGIATRIPAAVRDKLKNFLTQEAD